MTPGGMPASSARRASASEARGASSAGLTTIVLPAPMAEATSWMNIGAGAFHGMIAATTPYGSRTVRPSVVGVCVGSDSPRSLSTCPAMNCRMPPSGRGPREGRPTSMDSRASISVACWSTTSAQRRSSAARTAGLAARHAGRAAAAASTAASMSAAVPRGTAVSALAGRRVDHVDGLGGCGGEPLPADQHRVLLHQRGAQRVGRNVHNGLHRRPHRCSWTIMPRRFLPSSMSW